MTLLANPAVRAEFGPDAFRIGLLERTLGYNASAALIATAMGIPAGIVLGRGRGWIAKLLWVVLPAAFSTVAFICLWLGAARTDHASCVSSAGRHVSSQRPGGCLSMHLVARGVVVGGACGADWGCRFGGWIRSVQQQAVLDGALRRVTLRQLAGPIIASMAIVTILASQEFAVYEPTGISVVATEVRMVFDTGCGQLAGQFDRWRDSRRGGDESPDQPARAAAAVATATPLLACHGVAGDPRGVGRKNAVRSGIAERRRLAADPRCVMDHRRHRHISRAVQHRRAGLGADSDRCAYPFRRRRCCRISARRCRVR